MDLDVVQIATVIWSAMDATLGKIIGFGAVAAFLISAVRVLATTPAAKPYTQGSSSANTASFNQKRRRVKNVACLTVILSALSLVSYLYVMNHLGKSTNAGNISYSDAIVVLLTTALASLALILDIILYSLNTKLRER
jgi:hypothetical protein